MCKDIGKPIPNLERVVAVKKQMQRCFSNGGAKSVGTKGVSQVTY